MTDFFYRRILKPLLFRLDPETAHHIAMTTLSRVSQNRLLLSLFPRGEDRKLERTVFGVKFPNPIGLAAGMDIGKSKITPVEEAATDYVYSFERLFPFADYFVLNISSPNTPGLRSLQGREALDELLRAVQEKNSQLSAAPASTFSQARI